MAHLRRLALEALACWALAGAAGCQERRAPSEPPRAAQPAPPSGAANPWTRVRAGDWVRVQGDTEFHARSPLHAIVKLEAVEVHPDHVLVAVLPEANPSLTPEGRAGGVLAVSVHPERKFEVPLRQTDLITVGGEELAAFCNELRTTHVATRTCVTHPFGKLTLVNGLLSWSQENFYRPGTITARVLAAGHDDALPAAPPGGWKVLGADEPTHHAVLSDGTLDEYARTFADGYSTLRETLYAPLGPGERDPDALVYQGKRYRLSQSTTRDEDLAEVAISWALGHSAGP